MISAILYCLDSVHIILESFNSNKHHMIVQVTAKFVLFAVDINSMCILFLWSKMSGVALANWQPW